MCIEHQNFLEDKTVLIKTFDKSEFLKSFLYCKKCEAYWNDQNMKKDLRGIALDWIKQFNRDYRDSDITNVEIRN